MKLSLSVTFATLAAGVSACARHDAASLALRKRQEGQPNAEWAYEASFNWGRLDPGYALCQTGTQQSPIPLSLSNGLALNHQIDFNYPDEVNGTFFNWDYGPAFTIAHEEDVWTENPSITYDNQTVYLAGWHIHSPADHSVGGDRSKAEMHFVHVDAEGHEKAVLAFRLDPGNRDNAFFSQLPASIGFNETEKTEETMLNHNLAVESVLNFNEFWTYEGSLTSPPCHEGIRWFVARQILFTGVQQMRDILGASTYSARAEQEVWLHRINE
ncbi:alpha carbonic anhydrase [Dactylonectria estremocensis]|uniref:Alpha carbonic anhydrase n=1 Tax=Dactylonectria estremocensis TaxID=1079267 RepID=A0A9P9IAC1_9HYPO|nr:alpha carbonic anhydrase [Dactylonectria estremocensis]